jgi:DNA mismatch repair protein MSH6
MALRKYIVSGKREDYGIALLESQTNVITLAFVINEGMTYEHLKTLLLQTRPAEVVIDSENIPDHDPVGKMLRSGMLACSITKLKNRGDNWDNRKAIQRLEGLG